MLRIYHCCCLLEFFSLAYLYNLYCKAVSKFDYNLILIPVMLQYLFLSLSESAIINTYLWGGLFFLDSNVG